MTQPCNQAIKNLTYGTVTELNDRILAGKYTPAQLTEWLHKQGIEIPEGIIDIHCKQIKERALISWQLEQLLREFLSNYSDEKISRLLLDLELCKKLFNSLLQKLHQEKDKRFHKNSQPKPDYRLIPYAGIPTDKPDKNP